MRKDKNKQQNGTINSISEGTEMTGEIKAIGDFRLAGTFKGQLECDGKVVITEHATMEGNVKCNNLDLYGFATGDIEVDNLLSIGAKGVFSGNIQVGRISVEEGATLNINKCVMQNINANNKKK